MSATKFSDSLKENEIFLINKLGEERHNSEEIQKKLDIQTEKAAKLEKNTTF